MDVKNVNTKQEVKAPKTSTPAKNNNSSANFKEELKGLEQNQKQKPEEVKQIEQNQSEKKDNLKLSDKLNHSEERNGFEVKKLENLTDNNLMINNDFTVNDKDNLPQMSSNMNFSGDGQPFSSFMNNSNQNQNNDLHSTAKDLAEEVAILSSMDENLAMANKTKIVTNESGILKVNIKDRTVVENIVKFDSIIMNQADVEFFANLVENKELNIQNLSVQASEKAGQVSKTLADMLVKSKENNQPLRIDFDNNISVIIKISRDGKISADFLPSSQVAEAYLKENLPILRQRFDDNNIQYNELNQRERREQRQQDNRKKGNKDE